MRKMLLALVIGALLFQGAPAQAEGGQTYSASQGTRFQQLQGFGTAALTPSGEFTLVAPGVGPSTRIAAGWKFAVPASAPSTAVVGVEFDYAKANAGGVAAYQVSGGSGTCSGSDLENLNAAVSSAGTCTLGTGTSRFITVTFSGTALQAEAVSLSGQLKSVTLTW